jgi:hypothetical protein
MIVCLWQQIVDRTQNQNHQNALPSTTSPSFIPSVFAAVVVVVTGKSAEIW